VRTVPLDLDRSSALGLAADTGLPVGAQLVAGPWQEAALLRVAAQVEQLLPWADRRPAPRS
jgi:amidase